MHSNFLNFFYRRKSIRSTTVLVSAPKWPTRTSGNLARNNCEPTKGTSDCKPDLTKERRRPASVPSAILGTCKKDRGTDDFFVLFCSSCRSAPTITQHNELMVFFQTRKSKKKKRSHSSRALAPKISNLIRKKTKKTKTYCAY